VEEFKVEVEVLMNMELAIESFPETVEVSSKLIEPEKTDNLLSFDEKQKLEGDSAFQEKSKRKKKSI
jgi:ATP-dependent RNA helicase RhlE